MYQTQLGMPTATRVDKFDTHRAASCCLAAAMTRTSLGLGVSALADHRSGVGGECSNTGGAAPGAPSLSSSAQGFSPWAYLRSAPSFSSASISSFPQMERAGAAAGWVLAAAAVGALILQRTPFPLRAQRCAPRCSLCQAKEINEPLQDAS